MKYLISLLFLISYVTASSQTYIDSDSINLIYKLIKEYRSDNELDTIHEFILDTSGSDILINKTRWQSFNHFATHNADSNDSWRKCWKSADSIVSSLGYKVGYSSSYEIALMTSVFNNISVDSAKSYINSSEYAKYAFDSWKESKSHNLIMLEGILEGIHVYPPLYSSHKSSIAKFIENVSKFIENIKDRIFVDPYDATSFDMGLNDKFVYVISIATSCYIDIPTGEDLDTFTINSTCVITRVHVY